MKPDLDVELEYNRLRNDSKFDFEAPTTPSTVSVVLLKIRSLFGHALDLAIDK